MRKIEIGKESFRTWFEKIYEDNFEQLYRYAFSIIKDKQLAEDVVADIFMNIWDKKQDYSNILKLKSYLRVSVKHLAIRLASKDLHGFNYSKYDETLEISDKLDPENLLLGKELENVISNIVREFTPHCRIVYEMARNKGYSNDQIAKELQISKRTVEAHLYNVMKKFKQGLEHYFQESGKIYNFPY